MKWTEGTLRCNYYTFLGQTENKERKHTKKQQQLSLNSAQEEKNLRKQRHFNYLSIALDPINLI